MFDLQAQDGSVRRKEFNSPIPASKGEEGARQIAVDKLDSADMIEMHHRLVNMRSRELDRQYDNRREQAQDEDFYDNLQWDPKDAQDVEDRGQKALVYNVISASVDWVLGTEKRTRSDHKIIPRRKDDGTPAQRKSELMKYLSDVNRTPFHTSRAFADSVKGGVGWIEDYIDDEGEDEPLRTRYESWRRIVWDSASTEMDLSDARYLFRDKWVDLDIAKATFPKRAQLLADSALQALDLATNGDDGDEVGDYAERSLDESASGRDRVDHGFHRERVRLIEGWLRIPVKTKRLKGGTFHREIFDPHSRGHVEAVNSGEAEVIERVTMRMHVSIFTQVGLVWFSESPYRHNSFPFTPIWGKRRGRDGLPYGMIRGLKGMQEDINKRASKALYILSTNKIIMDHDAVEDIDELREEAARPDAIIIKKHGTELKLNTDRELSQYQLDFMSRSIAMIQQSSGVTDELLGRHTNATSGIAIGRRQDQGSMATMHFFDNLRLASQLMGEKRLSNIEAFVSEEKSFRITNMRGKPEYVTVNDGLPEHDIQRSKADFVITDADWRASMRQAAMDELMAVIAKLPPMVGMVLLDLVVEQMDIGNREEIVKRIRAVTGQRDPDAEEPTPEELEAQKAAQAQAELQARLVEAELADKEAGATKKRAEAERITALTVTANVDAQAKALTAAGSALAMPPAASHTADVIMAESGFQSQSEKDIEAARQVGVADAEAELAQQAMVDQAAQAQADDAMPQHEIPQPGSAPGQGLAP